ncbi:MAG: hypothetical protein QM699_00585 [Amaricoccus sp.]|uniref:hypothetical protein n=1 Tax=Amaricoccus sp. TaxID=1872485 RepID=UPI0039E3DDF6
MTTLRIIEDVAEADWPAAPAGLSTAAMGIPSQVIWRRLESWIAWRWGQRPVTFIVEGGCGSWRPPLYPVVATTVERWDGEGWAAVTLSADPLGGLGIGEATHYRIAGTLGIDDDPPEDVAEAYRRLAEYSAERPAMAGATSYSAELGSTLKESWDRAPTWLARALTYSGAADLLRPYRRAP